jgi:hypothetical protein
MLLPPDALRGPAEIYIHENTAHSTSDNVFSGIQVWIDVHGDESWFDISDKILRPTDLDKLKVYTGYPHPTNFRKCLYIRGDFKPSWVLKSTLRGYVRDWVADYEEYVKNETTTY